MKRISRIAIHSFAGFILLSAMLGLLFPGWFAWVGTDLFEIGFGSTSVSLSFVHIGLGLIMFGMGMTLSMDDVRRSLSHPSWISLGVLAQYTIMPLVAFGLTYLLQLDAVLAAGVILVGCCPGGTASNVITYLADADVPLSVSITLVSTFVAPLATPWLTWLYAQYLLGFYTDEVIEVPVFELMLATMVIVGPIVMGLLIKRYLNEEKQVAELNHLFTVFSIVIISLLVTFVVGMGRDRMIQNPWTAGLLVLPVVLHNTTGLLLGYGVGRLLNLPLSSTRAVSIEVGMQNSGLGLALAGLLVGALEKTGSGGELLSFLPLPAVIFSFWHNLSGSVLASWWRGPNIGRPDGDLSNEGQDLM